MKKIIASALLLIMGTCAFAQQSVTFKWKYLPNSKYTMLTGVNMDMTMDIQGSPEEMEKAKQSGVQMPMLMKMDTKMQGEITTGTLNGTPATFPLQMKYTSNNTHVTMNGKDMPIPQSNLAGVQVDGVCDANGKLTLNTINGTDTNAQLQTALVKLLNNFQEQIKFPDKPVAIGDVFTQEMPMDLPIPGMKAQITMKATYKLISINDGIANFDVDQVFKFNFDPQQGSTTQFSGAGGGKGSGKVKFDIAKSMLSDMQNDMTMDFTMNVQGMNMKMGIKGINNYHVDLASK